MPTRNPFNRILSEGIRRAGFRKWYERELLSSHAHMVLAIFAALGIMGSFEAFKGASMGEKLMDVGFIIVCSAIGVWALRRYLYLLGHAEQIANQAECARCHSYGLLKVVDDLARADAVHVRCKKCGHEWLIED